MTFGTQLVRHPSIPVDDGYGLTSLVDDINSHAYAPTTTASMVSRVHKFFAFLTRYRLWETDFQGLNATVPAFDWIQRPPRSRPRPSDAPPTRQVHPLLQGRQAAPGRQSDD